MMRHWIQVVTEAAETAGAAPLAERAEINSASFKRWFAGSKVVDRGRPLLCYHGSIKDFEGNAFHPFTHFGTLTAAQGFTWGNVTDGHSARVQDMQMIGHIQPVYLRITRPFRYQDGESHEGDVCDVAHAMRRKKLIDRPTYERLRAYAGEQDIINMLTKLGYDGLSYRNHLEDTGNLSWVIFRSDQVWPLLLSQPDTARS